MDISDYRSEFAHFSSAFELAHYKHRAGFERELHIQAVYDRYSDLFRRESIDDLWRAKESVAKHLETQRAGLSALHGAALSGYLEAHVRDLTDERARCESEMRIEWSGEPLSIYDAPKIIANETDAPRRRDLAARWADAIGSCNDLRAARFDSFHEESRRLGSDSYCALYAGIKGIDYAQLADSTKAFLDRTQNAYTAALAQWAARSLPEIAVDDLQHADYFYFQRLTHLDAFFPSADLMKTYVSAMNNLGIRTEAQSNIQIDVEARPFKNPRAACFRINPPDDVRMLVAPIGGAHDYMVFFHEAGHAQHFGWASHEQAKHHPEFIYAPDYATSEAYAFLFSNLFHDPAWLVEQRNLSAETAHNVVRDLALLTLHDVRRYCAKLHYELQLHTSSSNELRSEQLAATYATLQHEATLFARSQNLYLWDVDDGLYVGDYLRAWAFEVGLREHLRMRYGRRWWASRKAGDELIDLWNTASRYSVEELARHIGFGAISFELLADALIANIRAS